MPTVPFLGSYGDISGSGLMFRNKLINGGFDIWQRGTSQTASAIGSADRWNNQNSGSTKTTSRQAFTLGQTDVPGNPTYFCRTVVSSVAGSGNYCSQSQAIESVTTLAGATATLSFWAKADAAKNIAVEFGQIFGTGGSPSSTVNGLGVTTCALTTSWKLFTVTTTLPSVSGKTLGTNNDNFLFLNFWFDAGSSFNSRTNSLGQQSGTFDISNIQLEAGSVATPFEQRPIGTEFAMCQRFYHQKPNVIGTSQAGYNNYAYLNSIQFPVEMRRAPTVSVLSALIYPAGTSVTLNVDTNTTYQLGVINTAGTIGQYMYSYTANAEF